MSSKELDEEAGRAKSDAIVFAQKSSPKSVRVLEEIRDDMNEKAADRIAASKTILSIAGCEPKAGGAATMVVNLDFGKVLAGLKSMRDVTPVSEIQEGSGGGSGGGS